MSQAGIAAQTQTLMHGSEEKKKHSKKVPNHETCQARSARIESEQ